MLQVALGQLRHRVGRTLALLLGIAVAATSFSVLTGAAETQRLEVRGTVTQNFRSTYDLLVRPPGSYTELEAEQGLVRPNYQSGIFGGISTDQLAAIRGVTDVEVAAPVANLGYVDFGGPVVVPVERYLDGDDQQLFRITPTWTMDRGTSRFVGTPSYVYVSRNKTVVLPRVDYRRDGAARLGSTPTYAEVVPGRTDPVPVCTNYNQDKDATVTEGKRSTGPFGYRDPYSPAGPFLDCYYLGTTPPPLEQDPPDGAGDPKRLESVIGVSMPVLVAAVDPAAEAALWGLDRAVVAGRMLAADEKLTTDSFGNLAMPVLLASEVDLDQQVSAVVERVRAPGGERLSDVLSGESGVVDRMAGLPGTRVGRVAPVESTDIWERETSRKASKSYSYGSGTYWAVGPSAFERGPEGELRIRPVDNPESVFRSDIPGVAPVGSDDAAVRALTGHPNRSPDNFPGFHPIGTFDPARAAGTGELTGLTAETYVSPLLPGADDASRAALGDQPLAPTSNLGGYAAQRPAMLTTLDAAAPLLDGSTFEGASDRAPISVVRVRVAGVAGPDPVSRERLNVVALTIAERTGLAVDIVAGASGVPTTVVLPAGEHGRPELRLTETWARKGVAYTVISAVDRKSVVLFGLILATCALVVGNAAAAAVRTRRTELGVLSGLGWGAGRLFGVVLVELALIGLTAGVLGGLVALGLGAVGGVDIDIGRAGLAVPVAVGLAVLAGLGPALRAARATPVDAVRPLVWAPRRVRPVRSVAGMAATSLRRTPGRTGLAAAGLGIAVAAATVLLAVQQQFRGQVIGTLLGNAVTVQVRTPDLVALAAIGLLGAYAVADVLYLAIREQAVELAVLRGSGWSGAALTRLVLGQAVGIGLLGSLLGAGVGVGVLAGFAASWAPGLLRSAGYAAAAGLLAAVLAAIVPALLVRRLPVAALVSEEA